MNTNPHVNNFRIRECLQQLACIEKEISIIILEEMDFSPDFSSHFFNDLKVLLKNHAIPELRILLVLSLFLNKK